MSAPATVSTPRRTLADQIDRLDAVLDGLADAIPGVVDACVRDAVSLAVRDAVRTAVDTVITDPAVLARIRSACPPVQTAPAVAHDATACEFGSTRSDNPARPEPLFRRLADRFDALLAWLLVTRHRAVTSFRAARKLTYRRLALAYRWRKPVLAGLTVAPLVALICHQVGTTAASLMCAASAFALSISTAALKAKDAACARAADDR